MRHLLKFSFVACLGLMMFTTACDDTKEPDGGDPTYSKLTPDEHKAKLEETGTKLLAQIDPEDHKQAVLALSSLSDLLVESDDSGIEYPQVQALQKLTAKIPMGEVIRIATGESEITKISDAFGVYTYNSVTKDWDESPATDRLEYNYPLKGSLVNTAKLLLTYSPSTTIIDGVEVPSEVTVKLTVGGVEQLALNATYTGEWGKQTDVVKLTIAGKYVLEANLVAKEKTVTCHVSFKKGNTILMDGGIDLKGGFKIPTTEGGVESESEKIETAVVAMDLMSEITLAASGNVATIINEMNKIPDNLTEKAQLEAETGIVNKNVAAALVYSSSKLAIATLKFGIDETTETQQQFQGFDSNGNPIYKDVTYTYYDVLPLLVFGDGSQIDIESYFDDEKVFSSLIKEFENLIQKYEDILQ